MKLLKTMNKHHIFTLIVLIYISATFLTIQFAEAENEPWKVSIRIETEDETLYQDMVFGETQDASSGKDEFDKPLPPAPQTPYLRAWFSTSFAEPYSMLWEEYKPISSSFNQWNLSILYVSENISSTTITMTWETNNEDSINHKSLKLQEDGSIIADMTSEKSYSFEASVNSAYSFEIVSSTEENNGSSDTPSEETTDFTTPLILIVALIVIIIIVFFIFKKR